MMAHNCVNCEVSLDEIEAVPSMAHSDKWRCSDVYACHVRLVDAFDRLAEEGLV